MIPMYNKGEIADSSMIPILPGPLSLLKRKNKSTEDKIHAAKKKNTIKSVKLSYFYVSSLFTMP